MHAFWNSIGFSFLSSTIIFLMAIHFGATNIQLGYIDFPFSIYGIKRYRGIDYSTTACYISIDGANTFGYINKNVY